MTRYYAGKLLALPQWAQEHIRRAEQQIDALGREIVGLKLNKWTAVNHHPAMSLGDRYPAEGNLVRCPCGPYQSIRVGEEELYVEAFGFDNGGKIGLDLYVRGGRIAILTAGGMNVARAVALEE